jgi:hypothetical protein
MYLSMARHKDMDMCALHAFAQYLFARFVMLHEPFPVSSQGGGLNRHLFVALNHRGRQGVSYDAMVRAIKPYMMLVPHGSTKVLHAFRGAGAQHLDQNL